MIPARAVLETFPVGRPAEIGGIDVGGQAFFESMQLVRAAEMHLAGQNRPIASGAKIVRECRSVCEGNSAALS